MKLGDIIGRNVKGLFGVEVEVEFPDFLDNPPAVNEAWDVVHDGSLRNGLEMVFRRPRELEETKDLYEELRDTLVEAGAITTFRTSTHVHVNALDLTKEEIFNMIYLYYLYEEQLHAYCGDSRQNNRFCLTLEDCEGIVDQFERLIVNWDVARRGLREDQHKYAALNFCTLFTLGTVEFRGMEGLPETERFNNWTEALNGLKEAAKGFKSPRHIYAYFNRFGPKTLANRVFGKPLVAELFGDRFVGVERKASILISIPYLFE